jgi:uncharacterized phage protein (TIGR02218 family)
MSYELIETSTDDGQPVELFEIAYSGQYWRYTSAATVQTRLTSDYTPIPCGRTDLEPTSDPSKSDMTFTFPRSVEVGEIFRIQPPSEVVTMTVYGKHVGDPQFIVIWKGRIITADWEGPYIKLIGESVFSSLRRPGLRRRFQYQCPYALYSQQCGVNRDAWKESRPLSSISGLNLQVMSTIGKPDNFYAGGYVTWINNINDNIEKRMIRSSNGTTGVLTLSNIPLALSSGQLLTLYPGCDHTLGGAGCSKFSNTANFGGQPFIPKKNPFGGASIY